MCIAIYKPGNKVLTEDTLKTCREANKDGQGFAYIRDGEIYTFKTMDFDLFLSKYKEAETNYPESPFLIHFRISTHGTVDVTNCHPFIVRDDLVFIHNGVIANVDAKGVLSDTQVFNEEILKKLPEGWEEYDAVWKILEEFVGYSKLVFLRSDGQFRIIGESRGDWVDGIWYSNSSYKPKVPVERAYDWDSGFSRTRHIPSDYTVQCGECLSFVKRSKAKFVDPTSYGFAYLCKKCKKMYEDMGLLTDEELKNPQAGLVKRVSENTFEYTKETK